MELFRRLKIVVNNDAIYYDHYSKKNIINEKCEGFSVHNSVYMFLQKNPEKYFTKYFITQEEYMLYDNAILNGDFFVGKFNLDLESFNNNIILDKMVDSGDFIHMCIFVQINGKYFSNGNLTSNNDENTTFIEKQQKLNHDINEKDNIQYIRFYKQILVFNQKG